MDHRQTDYYPSRHFEYGDLEFRQIKIESGTPGRYPKWIDTGMPKLPPNILRGVFYLYSDVASAEAGKRAGGTGFFVSVPSTRFPEEVEHRYAVTNWHVPFGKAASPVIRLSKKGGGFDPWDIGPEDWTFHPSGSEIAVLPLNFDTNIYDHATIPVGVFATEEEVRALEIGPGEDVFMIGRFVDHDGGLVNMPAARFGNISIMPAPMPQRHGKMVEAYCIDMHSRTGFSGSPVFAYRTLGSDLSRGNVAPLGNTTFFMLLGIHYAQFPEFWELKQKKIQDSGTDEMVAEAKISYDGAQIEGLSGMTLVVPSWRILEILNMPKFVARRDAFDAEYALNRPAGRPKPEGTGGVSGPMAEGADVASDANPSHQEDFTRLLDAAARKKPRAD